MLAEGRELELAERSASGPILLKRLRERMFGWVLAFFLTLGQAAWGMRRVRRRMSLGLRLKRFAGARVATERYDPCGVVRFSLCVLKVLDPRRRILIGFVLFEDLAGPGVLGDRCGGRLAFGFFVWRGHRAVGVAR